MKVLGAGGFVSAVPGIGAFVEKRNDKAAPLLIGRTGTVADVSFRPLSIDCGTSHASPGPRW